MKRFIEFLGLKRSIVGILLMVILVGLGERMAERFLPIYLIALGGGALSVGLLNGLANLLSALYSFPGGYLSDRIGTKKALLVFNCMAALGYVLVIAVPRWYAVIAGAFFFLSWSAISLPATMSIVAKVLPREKRTMGVSMHSLVRRFPMALGPLLGGLFIGCWGEVQGVRLAFMAALLMVFLSIVLQQKLLTDEKKEGSEDNKAEKNPLKLLPYLSKDLRNLLISDILVRFCEQIPYAFVVIWCMKVIRAPVTPFQFGILTAIEMATAVIIYIPTAYFADRTGKKPFVAMTFVFFSLFPLILPWCQSFPLLVGAFIIRGLKEFGEPTRKALIMDLAPEDRKAAIFGLYYLIRDSIVSLAAFGGAFLWEISPAANFLAAFFFGVLGTLWYTIRGKDLNAPAS
jgi:MFS family permease